MTDSVLIVGASVAGVGAANELRRCGYNGAIVLIDGQLHLPYDRPPLSKAALADVSTPIHFHDLDHYRDNSIDLILGDPAVALLEGSSAVKLASGRLVEADIIIIATGARARRLPAELCNGPVHVIRDADDATNLSSLLRANRHLILIGGGFIGAETAATAIKLGMKVSIIDADPIPLARILGEQVAERVNTLHKAAGVNLLLGSGVTSVATDGEHQVVTLTNGSEIRGDVVVAGLGALPNIEWLADSGLMIDNGIVCDEFGRTSRPNVFAAGDVAAWVDPIGGKTHRHEHWTAAREQARIVAQTIVGESSTNWGSFVPYFWSDIHGKRVQLLGSTNGATNIAFVFENPETGAFVAEYRHDNRLIGVAGLNAAAKVMRYSTELAASREP